VSSAFTTRCCGVRRAGPVSANPSFGFSWRVWPIGSCARAARPEAAFAASVKTPSPSIAGSSAHLEMIACGWRHVCLAKPRLGGQLGHTIPGASRSAESCGVRHNMSIDTDPNLQEAASPHTVVVRSFLR